MKTPNTEPILPDMTGPDEDDDDDLRAVTTAELDDDDTPGYQSVDEFANEFLVPPPRGKA